MIKTSVVNKLKSIHELTFLMYLETGEWTHNKQTREKLSNHLGIAEITLKVTLKRLLDAGHISKPARGKYKINQEICQS